MAIEDVIIRNVRIQNYRSLRDMEIRLNKGLNVIIGDNGAGKSNFLRFLHNRFEHDLYYSSNSRLTDRANYSIDVEFTDDKQVKVSNISGDKGVHYPRFRDVGLPIVEDGKKISTAYPPNLENSAVNEPQAQYKLSNPELGEKLVADFITYNIPTDIIYISSPGKLVYHTHSNIVEQELPDHFDLLFSQLNYEIESEMAKRSGSDMDDKGIREIIYSIFERRKERDDYIQFLKEYSPIKDIRLNPSINSYIIGHQIHFENIVLEFYIDDMWVPWSYLSDGTARLFHIITEIIVGGCNIILIDEPEMGIHPEQLFKLMDFLKLQSETRQIIVATHSPLVIDTFEPEELDQIIIAKMTNQGTHMHHLSDKKKEKAKAYMENVGNLSIYWLHSDLEE